MDGKFGTVINCMDGRVQNCVNKFVQDNHHIDFLDTITLAGPAKILSENKKEKLINGLKHRIDISINVHHSDFIAVVGHFDCAAIKFDDEIQKELVKDAAKKLKEWYPEIKIVPLWIDSDLSVTQL